jgi:hypothetical protein
MILSILIQPTFSIINLSNSNPIASPFSTLPQNHASTTNSVATTHPTISTNLKKFKTKKKKPGILMP